MLKKLSSLFGIFAISFAFVGCEPQGTETDTDTTETEAPAGDAPEGDMPQGSGGGEEAEPAELDEDATEGGN